MAMQRTVLGVILGATIIGMLPVFLIGSLAPAIQAELHVGESAIGFLVATFFALSALASIPSGRVVQSLGWAPSLVALSTALIAASVLMNISAFGFSSLCVALAIAGIANGISHPAANVGIVSEIPRSWRGFAFGIKQAAVPIATLTAGLAVPSIALQYGWRATFLGLAGISVLVGVAAFAIRTKVSKAARPPDKAAKGRRDHVLFLLSAGAGFGSAAANSMGAFLVVYVVAKGYDVMLASALLIAGSVANIAIRLFMGWTADRRSGGHIAIARRMMVIGALSTVVLAFASSTWMLALATLAAFGIGWGWNGLLHHGAMQIYHNEAASATSVVQAALFGGAVIGPLTFGFAATHFSYQLAWILIAAYLLAGSILIQCFRTRLIMQGYRYRTQ